MTLAELKSYIATQLTAPVTLVQKVIDSFDAVIDFITQSDNTGIPAWLGTLTFNTDGTGDGSFCTYVDDDNKLRFWKTKTDGNINHTPPTSVIVTENTYWIEVSPANGSAIKEWAPGVFGTGLIIVFYDINGDGTDPALYKLNEAVRPYNSANFTTELAAGKWARTSKKEILHATAAGTDTYTATLSPAIAAYVTDLKVYIKFTNANTGAATLNLNSLGAKAIKKSGSSALALGDIAAGQILCLVYDGTNFQVVGGGASGGGGSSAWGGITGTVTDQTDLVAYIASAVAGLMDYRGTFDASVNAYPSSGGSGTAGAILKSDFWIVSVAGTLPTGLIVAPGDLVIAKQDTPGNTEANWSLVEYNIGYTPENAANKTDTMTGNEASSVKYLSSKGVYDWGVATFAPISGSANYWKTGGTSTLASANTIVTAGYGISFTGTGTVAFGGAATAVSNIRMLLRGVGTTTDYSIYADDSAGNYRFYVQDNGTFFSRGAQTFTPASGNTGTFTLSAVSSYTIAWSSAAILNAPSGFSFNVTNATPNTVWAFTKTGTLAGSSTMMNMNFGTIYTLSSSSGATRTINLVYASSTGTLSDATSTITVNHFSNNGTFSEVTETSTHRGFYHTINPGASCANNYAFVNTTGFTAWQSIVSPAQITADQNNYNPTGWRVGSPSYGASIMRLNTDAKRTITSLAGGKSGRLGIIDNVGSFEIVFTNDDAAGTAANRYKLPNGKSVTLRTNESAFQWYDVTDARWHLIGGVIQDTGWTLPTGTALKGFAAVYPGQTVSAGYVQAESKQMDDEIKKLSQTMKALLDHLYTNQSALAA